MTTTELILLDDAAKYLDITKETLYYYTVTFNEYVKITKIEGDNYISRYDLQKLSKIILIMATHKFTIKQMKSILNFGLNLLIEAHKRFNK